MEIATGARHSCAVDDEGVAWCWGDGSHGQLGAHGVTGSALPVRVSTRTGMRDPVVGISAGRDTTCATTAVGAAYCWGSDAYGQLGPAGRGDRDELAVIPARGALRGKIREIAVGGTQACAVDTDGRAFCWGSRALGSGPDRPRFEPVAVGAAGAFDEIAAGGEHTCGLDRAGRASCWGEGAGGRLGNGGAARRTAPVGVRSAALRDIDSRRRAHLRLRHPRVRVLLGQPAQTAGSARPLRRVAPYRCRSGDCRGHRWPRRACGCVRSTAACGSSGARPRTWGPVSSCTSGRRRPTTARRARWRSPPRTAASWSASRTAERYDVAVLVRTRDGLTVSNLVTGMPAMVAPPPSGVPPPRRASVTVLPGDGAGELVTGLSPLALVALGTMLLGGGLAALLVRRR
nr:hypothetical protein GCM10020092_100800 [Actinoplanes digitatis]